MKAIQCLALYLMSIGQDMIVGKYGLKMNTIILQNKNFLVNIQKENTNAN